MKNKVSVMVVTYNSEKTILTTLESILSQTYEPKNIELVISDDCSKDRTLDVVTNWVAENGNKFYRAIIISKEENKGISHNCNTGWKACTSDWIKSIGGDDFLADDCLEKNFEYVNKNKECDIVFSKMKWFGRLSKVTPEPYNLPFFSLTAKEQYYYLMFKSFNIAPTSFISRKVLEDIGFADEKFTLIEDLPLWLKFTSKGYKLHFFPDITVYYRVENSTSKHEKRYVNIPFLQQLIEINNSLKFRTMPGLYYMLLKLDTLVLLYGKVVISTISKNRVGNLSRFLDFIHFALRPIYIMHKLRRSYVNYRSRKKALH